MLDIKKIRIKHKLSQAEFGTSLGVSQAFISQIERGESLIPDDFISKLKEVYNLTTDFNQEDTSKRVIGRIPFFDDVASVGGLVDQQATTEIAATSTEWINAGDWFPEATAAIRHYGDSMAEYPPGCILALREVRDRSLIVWGKNYVIETSEWRITKRLQSGSIDTFIAYSTNTDRYPDGRLIHEPIEIRLDSVRRIFSVIGCVRKESSSGASLIS